MRDNPLVALLALFVPFSLTAFGGGLSVIPGIQDQAVNHFGWMTSQEFLNYFAISRAAPGPGSMLSTLIGWHVTGIAGAVVATLAMFIPSSTLCLGVAMIWRRYRGRRWLKTLEAAVAPIGVGLLIGGVATLLPLALSSVTLAMIGLASFAIATLRPNLHPVLILLIGAAVNAGTHLIFA